MTGQNKPPAPVRPAATVLIVRDDPFEVLMVKRHAQAFLGSALVFPGGMVEAADASPDWLPHLENAEGLSDEERAFRIAACREVFEETALWLATAPMALPPPAACVSAPDFLQLARSNGVRLDLGQLVPFAHWVAPEHMPKRFDTKFYICRAPAGHEAVCDGVETVSLAWVSPQELLQSAELGMSKLPFPTRMNLIRLAESSESEAALAASRARPHFVVRPWVEHTADGARLHIPLEAGYGITSDAFPPIS